MVKPPRPAAERSDARSAGTPEVLVDFSVDDGLLSVHLKNVGSRSAFLVRTRFDQRFSGAGRGKAIPRMRLFRKVEFMAPGKCFDHFVDSLAGYVRRDQPLHLVATVRYRDREGRRFEDCYVHDLRVYLELRSARVTRSTPEEE